MTRVIFRKWNERWATGTGPEVLGIFPDFRNELNGHVTCYAHLGQHGDGDYMVILQRTVLAKPLEYQDLLSELERIGYEDLRVVKRRTGLK